ncbi:N-6 DNA methylase [Streptomyces sp. NBC_01255]|uniref:type ISP restriction/modification enzyme n=1 Tax=Streptomyces sp. NBC_01255 TaxID=2903798 RepID=UPI002E37AD4A|nr:type ISP restriction/modification enzyme [Streptomyces sp. NBC_01255]
MYDWLRAAVSRFGHTCKAKLSGAGSPEASIRGPLENLLQAMGEHHDLREVSWHDEFRVADLGVRPDYAVRAGGEVTGYLELKKPGLSVDPGTFARTNREQWEKLRNLPNLLYSNGTEWRLFRDGQQLGETVYFTGALHSAGDKLALADPASFDALLQMFLLWKPPRIAHVTRLVQHLAPLCRLLRSTVLEQLAAEAKSPSPDDDARARPFTGLKNEWRRLLFPSADDATFADGYAQAVTFALLLARSEGMLDNGPSLHEIGRRLDADHALMGKALQLLTDHVNERFTVTLDLLQRTIAGVDWPAIRSGNQDAYLHLYEHFLTVYDPALRQKSGSYYTPHEVVTEMVRLTEDVLRTRLGQQEGFGGEDVRIVDPAMGTGTYLHTVIERVAGWAAERHGPAMAGDAVSRLASRLYGFELQMGPFAVAELRASDILKRHESALPEGGLNLFVTDTLDNPFVEDDHLPSLYGALSDSRRRANEVKARTPVTVVIGNPPFDDKAENRGGWVEKGSGHGRPLLDDFRLPGNGRYEHMLKNMYVYFWRWAAWKVFDTHEDNRQGVVCFISPSGWTTGPGGRGMREYLRRTCDEGWVINLSPEGQRSDVATRVFPGVAQPLAICVFVRRQRGRHASDPRAVVHYRSVSGKRTEKFAALRAIELDDDNWREAHSEDVLPFTPRTQSGWDEFPALDDLFPWGSPGVKPNRSWVSAPSAETLRKRWARLVREPDPVAKAELFKETRDRTLSGKRDPLPGQPVHQRSIAQEGSTQPQAVRTALRSFDRQWLIPDHRVIDFPRPDLWAATQQTGQLFLNQQSSHEIESGPAVMATHLIPDTHHFNGRGGRVMPLLHPDGSPNVLSGLLPLLARALGRTTVDAVDLAAYVLGITGHGRFTEHFAEELLTPGVRVPLTRDPGLWGRAVALGGEVMWASTYGHRRVDHDAGRKEGGIEFLPGDPRQVRYLTPIGRAVPEKMRYDVDTRTLHVGDGTFAPVPEAVWSYDVGGMHVVTKWFGYRKARPSSKRTSPLDDIHVDVWPAEWTMELIELLSVLRRLTDLAPAQSELLHEVLAGPVLTRSQMVASCVLPVKEASRKARRPAPNGLFGEDSIS